MSPPWGRFLAHHEQSETVSDAPDVFINVFGRRTQFAGRPLPVKHEFEAAQYGDLPTAILAAIVRSAFEGYAQAFTGGNLPGRRP